MAEVEQGRFACSGCGKQYRWKPELASKKAKCKCGTVMDVPAEAPGAPEEDLYALAPDDSAPKRVQPVDAAPARASGGGDDQYRCPSCTQGIAAGSVICVHCGFNLREGKKMAPAPVMAAARPMPVATTGGGRTLNYRGGPTARETKAAEENDMMFEGSIAKNLYLPIGLILLGLIIEYGQALYWTGDMVQGLGAATLWVGVTVFVNTTVMLIGVFAAAKILDIGFGPFWTAILKLVAIAIGPGAIGGIISTAMGDDFVGNIAGGAVSLGLYWGLFSLLFSLDFSETLNLCFIIWAVRWLVSCFLMTAIMGFFFSM
jgi:hypothetical protein